MTKRGDRLTVRCLQCGELFPYVYDRGRPRKFHADDHTDASGELTRCRWKYSNRKLRPTRTKRSNEKKIAAAVAEQVEAAVDARIRALFGSTSVAKSTTVRLHAGVLFNLTDDERADLLGRLAENRSELERLQGLTHERETAPVTLGHYRREVSGRFLPLLEEVETLLRRP